MPKNATFELFKQEIQQSQSTLDLINSLEQNQFNLVQLHELIHWASDNQYRSLLVIFFLNKLKENDTLCASVLNRLALAHPHHPIQKSQHQEDCLIFAIYCFLNGSQKKGLYLSYINLLTTQLLNQYYPFSLQTLQGLTLLLLRAELDPDVDEQLVAILFCHKVNEDKSPFAQVVQSIGQQGGIANYQQVINLSQWALTKLDAQKNQHIISSLQTAIKEAQLELELSQHTDFFSQLFGHFTRCFTYGWTGFFKPNLPTYVKLAAPDLIENREVYPQPLADFYSVAHFDLLVDTTLRYSNEQPKRNHNTANSTLLSSAHFQLMEMLFVNDFHKEIQEILHQQCATETSASYISLRHVETLELVSQQEDINEEELEASEIEEDSPFYGLIDSPASHSFDNSKHKVDDKQATTFIDTAKDFVNTATEYAEELVDNLKGIEEINTAKDIVGTASDYAGQMLSAFGEVPGWTKNMFFSISKPLLCTATNRIENKQTQSKQADSWL